MNTDQILSIFEPLLAVGLLRLSKFNKPEARDLDKIFGPIFQAISRAAGIDEARATERISSWDPSEAITMEKLHSAVRELTAPTMDAMALARAKTAALLAETASTPTQPRSERWDPSIPLSERSRQSLYSELKAEELNYNGMGLDGSRYVAINAELKRRDIALSGYNYTPLAQA